MDDQERQIERLAGAQRGRFSRSQVRQVFESVGAGERGAGLIRRRIRSERWRRLTSRVLAVPGASRDMRGQLWTTHLHVGADSVVSHASAALLWGFPAMEPSVPTVIVPDGANRRLEGARILQRADLVKSDVVRRHGLPVTTPARTLADLAAEIGRARLDAMVDFALAERLASMHELRRQLEVMTRPKKRLGNLDHVLSERLPGEFIEASVLERGLTDLLRRAGLPLGLAQYPLPSRDGDVEGLVDRAWPEIRWIVEVDGRRWHRREVTMQADRARDRAAQARGWTTTRFMYDDVVNHERDVVADLQRIHHRRTAEVAADAS